MKKDSIIKSIDHVIKVLSGEDKAGADVKDYKALNRIKEFLSNYEASDI